MAEKPSRSLVLYGDGIVGLMDPSHSYENLHSLASLASCGFSTLSNSPPSETDDDRIVREFALLLDSSLNDPIKQTLPHRFMGMKAAILTNHSGLKSFSANLGFSVVQLDELVKQHSSESQDSDVVAVELLKLLGFQEGKVLDNSQFDLVLLHVGAGEKVNDSEQIADVEFVDALVGAIMKQAQPGSDVGSRLHLSVVMSYGKVSENDESRFSVLKRSDEKDSCFSTLYPLQSYAMKGGVPRKDVRHHSPMLIAQLQHAVTRKDNAQRFSFQDFLENGGNLTIPADRFLHEIAFKMWKAPKYGA
ncbi:uncharacterized protein [Cicer arietinum]|uniref:Uncharacterized protein LOC101508458 isoform X2 n=1 Tax=Cicer arietinum TaxID=3827 RepID=A0A1S2Y5M0_CICAR|nr:uncharacterized protein LOC101508458 isoform X2 [Cicer arietinum]